MSEEEDLTMREGNCDNCDQEYCSDKREGDWTRRFSCSDWQGTTTCAEDPDDPIIAAAPEMLEALEKLHKVTKKLAENWPRKALKDVHIFLARTEDVIAKAKGEEG